MAGAVASTRFLITSAARHVGRRGAFLIFLALLDVVLGYAIVQPLPFGLTRAALYQPFVEIMPLQAWAAWWMATGVLAGIAAVWTRLRPVAFGAGALIKIAWSLGYLIGWVERVPAFSRGYQTAAIYLSFGLVTLLISSWRENGR